MRILSALLTLVVPSVAAADWTWFTSGDGAYAVEFPVMPSRTVAPRRVELGGEVWRLVTVTWEARLHREGEVYRVVHAALPAGVSGEALIEVWLREAAGTSGEPDWAHGQAHLAGSASAARGFEVPGSQPDEVNVVVASVEGVRGDDAVRFLGSLKPRPPAEVGVRVPGLFEATLPAAAMVRNEIVPTDAGIRHLHRYETWLEGHRYSVTWSDLEKPPKKKGGAAALDRERRDVLRRAGGRPLKERKSAGELTFSYRTPDGSIGHVRLLMREARLFEVCVYLTVDGPPAEATAARFLESFRLQGP